MSSTLTSEAPAVPLLNPLHPSVEPLLDPKVVEIYNKYQGASSTSSSSRPDTRRDS